MAKLNPFDLYDVASLLSEEELMIKESVARFRRRTGHAR